MNATCNPPAQSAPSIGVTESLLKPHYSVTGNAEAHEVRVELPGVRKDALHIHLEDNVLTLSAQRHDSVPAEWKALHRELPTQNYQLRLRVNTPVDEERLSASLENGILTLRLPIKETAKPRRIEVQ